MEGMRNEDIGKQLGQEGILDLMLGIANETNNIIV